MKATITIIEHEPGFLSMDFQPDGSKATELEKLAGNVIGAAINQAFDKILKTSSAGQSVSGINFTPEQKSAFIENLRRLKP